MQGFEDITLTWRGQDYVLPANQQLMAIARIEDALSGETGQQALSVLFRKEGPPLARASAAFGAALRSAGAKVTDDEVYLSIQEDFVTGSQSQLAAKINAMTLALMSVISPPAVRMLSKKEDAPKNL